MSANKIDTKRLRKKAMLEDFLESYETIIRKKDYKVGAGVRISDPKESLFFLEIVAPLCEEGERLNIKRLRRRLDVLEKIEGEGYTIRCDKDFIVCEKSIPEIDLEKEYMRLVHILKV